MLKKILNIRWISYHFWALWKLFITFHPFQFRNYSIPAHFKPMPKIGMTIFTVVCHLIIYFPVLLFVINLINGYHIPGILIVTIFGIFFSVIFRYTLSGSASHIIYDGRDLKFIVYGFYNWEEKSFRGDSFKSIVRLKRNFHGTANHKICLELQDGTLILLHLTVWKKKGFRLLEETKKLFNLPHNENPSNSKPINDLNISMGNN